jgi:hypothetical protein
MASRQRLFLPPADPEAQFIVARFFRLGGRAFKPARQGEPPVIFDKAKVNERKIRQLHVSRKIIMVPNTGAPPRRSHLAAHRAASSKAEAALASIFLQKDKQERERQHMLATNPVVAKGYRGPQDAIMEPPRKAADPEPMVPVAATADVVQEPPAAEASAAAPQEAAEEAEQASVYDTKDFLTEVEERPDNRQRQRGKRGR